MIVGMITIGTCHGDANIPVELLGNGPRPGSVWVRALGGCRPFTKASHGGPYQDDTALVYLPGLREIHLEETQAHAQVITPPIFQEDWFLESRYEDRTWINESG